MISPIVGTYHANYKIVINALVQRILFYIAMVRF